MGREDKGDGFSLILHKEEITLIETPLEKHSCPKDVSHLVNHTRLKLGGCLPRRKQKRENLLTLKSLNPVLKWAILSSQKTSSYLSILEGRV